MQAPIASHTGPASSAPLPKTGAGLSTSRTPDKLHELPGMCCGCVLLHQTHSPHPNLCRSLLHPTQGKGSCPGDHDSPRKTHSPGRRGERMALSAAMRAQVSWPGGYGDRGPFTPGPDRVPQDPHQPCPRPGALIEACWALSGNEISCFPGCPAHVSPASWHSTLIHRGPGLGSRMGRLSAPEIHLQEPCLRMDSRHRPDPRLCNPCPLGPRLPRPGGWRCGSCASGPLRLPSWASHLVTCGQAP